MQEVHRQQHLCGRAELLATKHSFVLLARALSGWQQLLEFKQRRADVACTLQV